MGQEVNLVRALPRTKRNIQAREDAKDPEIVRISKQFGEMYFDGPRDYGYGGYKYDGRWVAVAKDMIKHFDLKPGDKVLDVGCAKGFLVNDQVEARDVVGDAVAGPLSDAAPGGLGLAHVHDGAQERAGGQDGRAGAPFSAVLEPHAEHVLLSAAGLDDQPGDRARDQLDFLVSHVVEGGGGEE